MKKTKQKILDTARELFNELGYSQVTIRMIAEALKMSSGNLNYHFRKREDILEALYFEMVAGFDKRIEVLADQKLSLAFMQADIKSSMQRMLAYRFFWTDLYYLLQANEKIKAHFLAVKTERLKGYDFVFKLFIQQGLLQQASFPTDYSFLANSMMTYSNTWLYASALYENTTTDECLVEEASKQLLLMLYPYLTPSGQEDFKKLFA